ncbi:serine/threonine-protein kinase dyf-5-like [Mercenaria mercenaria]|uniref:serine/threonine-protein kinase dyf-5-like n=1 Tax=Mercenaria mercenaria TaxID=6596 RepID=UPI00234F5383|nr:serine/threonine-protein kinase dyf-5-like [Mercenaria mercenaria]
MNKYKILEPEPIDEGNSYRTWLAKNLKKDEKVAIKILKKNFYSLEECKRHKEVQNLQSLNHKNVLKMLELINDRNELLMVFEYMPENVKRVMQNRGSPYSETETKIIMQQVFQGLSHVHGMGFIHRNLRPEILLCDKEVTIVKISDFSMAKSVLDPLGEYVVSPLWYMSPEVLLGATDYTNKVDMWAAGCIMAELLTGKPLLPGTSDRDQMKLICELIGNFTTRQWQDGAMLRRSLGYSLPASNTGKGLGEAGVQASSDAKGLIMDLLNWAPNQRTSAELALRRDVFKSDGEFINKDESQEILNTTEIQLKEWSKKWEADLNRGSIEELDSILAGIYRRQPYRDRNNTRNKFAGFEKSNPLLGDSTPRDKRSQPETNGTVNVQTIDDPFRMYRPKAISEPVRTYPIDAQSPDKIPHMNPFEEELQSREEKRSRQSTHNVAPFAADGQISPQREPLIGADGQMSPRRSNVSPRRKINDQLGQLGEGPDKNQIEQEQKEKRLKAEQLKRTNPVKYRTIYGSARGIFGAGSPQPGGRSGPMRSKQVGSETNRDDDQKPPVRTRQQYGGDDENNMQTNMQNGLTRASYNDPMTQRKPPPLHKMTSFERFAAIDHTARSEKMKCQNPTKYKDKYGDPFMSDLLGKKPAPNPRTQSSQLQQNYSNGGDGGDQGLQNSGQYTPSWADNNQIRTH